jgi:hypothetical protein
MSTCSVDKLLEMNPQLVKVSVRAHDDTRAWLPNLEHAEVTANLLDSVCSSQTLHTLVVTDLPWSGRPLRTLFSGCPNLRVASLECVSQMHQVRHAGLEVLVLQGLERLRGRVAGDDLIGLTALRVLQLVHLEVSDLLLPAA